MENLETSLGHLRDGLMVDDFVCKLDRFTQKHMKMGKIHHSLAQKSTLISIKKRKQKTNNYN